MKTKIPQLSQSLFSILLIMIVGITAMLVIDQIHFSQNQDQTVQAAPSEAVTLYLPFTVNRYPLQTVFGIQSVPVEKGFSSVVALKSSWVRYNGLRWSSVEVNKGDRDWSAMVDLEDSLIRASQNGIEVILIVRSTPSWAQAIDGATCGPIKVDELTAFGQFMYDAVQRYSKPPFNVKYWEIWNEPDTTYVEEMATQPFGCWGDYNDEYFDGGYYADVLKVVYPYMKAADTETQVLIGGLLLDCDPGPDPNICSQLSKNDRPPKYLEGILRNGGGNYFDGVSFHAYDYFTYYAPALGDYSNANWGAAWNTTGPVSSLKAEFVREILSQYGVTGKYLVNTEAALICGPNGAEPGMEGCEATDDSFFEQTKARYVVQTYAASISDSLVANIWYDLYGWRNSGLLYTDSSPRPAYYAFEFARQELQNATFQQKITSYPNILAYEFLVNNRLVWVVWSLDGATHTISLPGTPLAAYDFMGNPLTPSSTINITLDPVYLEWTP